MLALVLAGLVTGCGGEEAGAKSAPPPAAAPVETALARAGVLVDERSFVGEVRSLRSAELALGAAGEIVMLEVREGDRVEAGQLLVELDKAQASARVSAAAASRRESERELEQARREAERAAELGDVLASETIEQDAARAEALEARKRRFGAEIRAAQAQLSDFQLLAPFDGIITMRSADLGQWVNPGETVLELVADEELEILVDLSPELAPSLRVGDRVALRPAAGVVAAGASGEREGEAEILGVVPALDRTTRTIGVRLRPLAPRPWLVPGAPVELGFPVRYAAQGSAEDPQARAIAGAVIVPRDALVLGAVDVRVILVEEGKARAVQVEVHASAGEDALVSGAELVAGAEVVTRGNERLRPGQEVRKLEPKPTPGAGGAGSGGGEASP